MQLWNLWDDAKWQDTFNGMSSAARRWKTRPDFWLMSKQPTI